MVLCKPLIALFIHVIVNITQHNQIINEHNVSSFTSCSSYLAKIVLWPNTCLRLPKVKSMFFASPNVNQCFATHQYIPIPFSFPLLVTADRWGPCRVFHEIRHMSDAAVLSAPSKGVLGLASYRVVIGPCTPLVTLSIRARRPGWCSTPQRIHQVACDANAVQRFVSRTWQLDLAHGTAADAVSCPSILADLAPVWRMPSAVRQHKW